MSKVWPRVYMIETGGVGPIWEEFEDEEVSWQWKWGKGQNPRQLICGHEEPDILLD